ncbi:hypothetical protein C2845_PM15G19360 [Panicum miliaceum]|uniref:Uncharacterized protein n=1 Tax=Panicum miliaceum TaxID=4540 RepID=A0A3L6Q4Y3_PANMI|nr:hypothetical protein C2845_PM15G19360 [Panicum miliaceum]
MSSGGGRSSLGYLFESEPEETTLYHTTAKSNQETEKTPDTNSCSVKDDNKMIGAEADQEPPQLPPPKREDRPSTRVRCAPGGPSSLGFLFGEEHEK